MKKIYLGFILIGLLGLIFVMFMGLKGAYFYNLAFALAFLKKRIKWDEREVQLARKVFVVFAGIMMVILVNFYILYQLIQMPEFIKLNWLGLMIGFAFVTIGLIGTIFFNKGIRDLVGEFIIPSPVFQETLLAVVFLGRFSILL